MHAVTGQADRSCVRCRVAAGQQGGEGVDVVAGGEGCGQDAAEIGLIDLAGGDVGADAAYAGGVRTVVEGGRPVLGRGAPPLSGHGAGTGRCRTSAKRAQTRRPSKSALTAQKPVESRAAGSSVTSRRPVATRPPKRARGGRWSTQSSLGWVTCGCPDHVLGRTDRSTLRKRVFVLAPESARVQHVAGTRKPNGTDKRT